MTVVDVTHLLGDERGTAFEHDTLMFSNFEDGAVFNYDTGTLRDYAEMLDRDGKALAIEQALTLPIRRAKRTIRRGPASVKVTKFVEQALFAPANHEGMSIPLNTVIGQVTGGIINKKAFFEKVWIDREVDGQARIVYDKLAWRPAGTCQIKRDPKTAAFRGFTQMPIRFDQTDPIFFKPEHAFVYIHGKTRNPLEGTSAMVIPYWCYQTKQKIRFLWYSFLEGQSLPKTIVKARTQGEADKAARKMLALKQGGIAAITEEVAVDAYESSGRGASQFKEALQWLDSESTGSALAGFLDLGGAAAGGTGSFALSKDQTDFFLMSREADADEMSDDFNNFVVADLVRWNFGPNEPAPIFEFGPISEDDAAQSITLLQALNGQTNAFAPDEFMNELVEKVAALLGMDTNRVRKGLEEAAKERKKAAEAMGLVDNGVAPVAGAVNAATKMVQQMQNPPDQLTQQPNQTATPRVAQPSNNPDTQRPRPVRASRNA
jgi:hypothetical protein